MRRAPVARIAFLHESLDVVGGGERVLLHVASLARARADLDLAILWGGAEPALRPDARALFDDVRPLGFPERLRLGTAVAHQRAQSGFRRWLEARRPDALLAFSFPIALRAAALVPGLGLPNAWFWQQSLPLFHSRFAGAKERASLAMLRRAGTRIVCPTQVAVRGFEALGVAPEQLRQICPGVDVRHFASAPQDDRGTFPSAERIPQADLCVVCVARLDPVKDHATVLDAVGLAAREGVRVALLCVGAARSRHDAYASTLRRRAESLGIADQVVWAGYQADVRPWLRAADAAVLASMNECAPLALVEAGAAGLPLLGARVGGIPELVEPGVTGALFDPGDAAACARIFVELARDAVGRARLGAAARERVRKDFDATSGDAAWNRLLDELLESRA